MNGYVTYSITDISGLLINASMMHTKIEKILEWHHLFLRDYKTMSMSGAAMQELGRDLGELITTKTKYDDECIVTLNNRLTKFIVAFANTLKIGDASPQTVSIEVELMEYVLFLGLFKTS